MNLDNVCAQSFCATLSREQKTKYTKDGEKIVKETSKKKWLKGYDDAIDLIERQKKCAIELDSFMRSDKVKKEIDKLPKNGTVQVACNFDSETFQKRHPQIPDFILLYDQDDLEAYLDLQEMSEVQEGLYPIKDDLSIDKKGIMEWLKMLNSYFER